MTKERLDEISSMSDEELKAATRILGIQCSAMLFVGDRDERKSVLIELVKESSRRGF